MPDNHCRFLNRPGARRSAREACQPISWGFSWLITCLIGAVLLPAGVLLAQETATGAGSSTTVGGPGATDGAEGGEEGKLTEAQSRSAKDALVLLSSNQQRVLSLGYDTGFSSSDNSSSDSPGVTSATLRAAEAAKAQKSLQITDDLVEGLGETVVTPLLLTMQESQRKLAGRAKGSSRSSTSSTTGNSSAELTLEFAIAEREAGQLLVVTDSERSVILQRYWNRLTDLDRFGSLSSSSLDPEDLDTPPLTTEELQKKQERYDNWLKDQRRMKGDQRRQEYERRQRQRAREEERRQRRYQPEARPKAGIDQEALKRMLEPEIPTGPSAEKLAEMETWYTFWTRKSLALKKSLQTFLPMPLDHRTQELIRACQNVYQSSATLFLDPVSKPPDPELAGGLLQTLQAFERAGEHCMYGRNEEAKENVELARTALRETMQRMAYFNLNF